MYSTIADFNSDWKKEEDATIKIFDLIDDSKLNVKVHDNVRTLGRLAWHITQTITEMNSELGLFDEDYLKEKPVPSTMKEIKETFVKYSRALAKNIEKRWKDESLSEEIEIYGETWKRSNVMDMLIKHQIHHRSQMTVVMRLLDLPVTGLYGPSKEEWKNYGMDAQE